MDGPLLLAESCLLHWFEASEQSHELSGNEKNNKVLTLLLWTTLNVININTEELNRAVHGPAAKPTGGWPATGTESRAGSLWGDKDTVCSVPSTALPDSGG